jgi:ATP-binding cassette subfamily B protein
VEYLLKRVKESKILFSQITAVSKRVVKLLWEIDWRLVAATLVSSFTSGVSPLLSLWIGKLLIDTIISGTGSNHGAFVREIVILLIIQFLMNVFVKSMELWNAYVNQLSSSKIKNHIQQDIMRKVSGLDIRAFDDPNHQDQLSIVQREGATPGVPVFFRCLVDSVTSIITVIASISILFTLNPIVSVAIFILTSFEGYREIVLNKEKFRITLESTIEHRLQSHLNGILTSKGYAEEVRLYRFSDYLIYLYDKLWGNIHRRTASVLLKRVKSNWLLAIVNGALNALIYGYSAITVIAGRITIGTMTLYIGAANQLYATLSRTFLAFTYLHDNLQHLLILFKYLDSIEESVIENNQSLLLPGGDDMVLELENVSFKYPGSNKYVLQNINLRIASPMKVAIVGPNGAGKTTLIRLLMRLYDPTDGKILLNGIDIREYNIGGLRSLFSTVFQDFGKYGLKVRENVAISDISRIEDDVAIHQALTRAQASFVDSFPNSLDTQLLRQFNVDGVNLSGGQWQRIAIARSFFRNAQFFIMDEPSSSLDPEAEEKALNELDELAKGKVSILISHRLANVTSADMIIFIEDGEIIEQGIHEELLELKGRYYKYFSLRAKQIGQII